MLLHLHKKLNIHAWAQNQVLLQFFYRKVAHEEGHEKWQK